MAQATRPRPKRITKHTGSCPGCGGATEHLVYETDSGIQYPSAKICLDCEWFEDMNALRDVS